MYTITGITGNVGGSAARALLERGETIRAAVRDPEKGAAWAARGAEVAGADLADARALAMAFEGASAAFVLNPPAYRDPDLFARAEELDPDFDLTAHENRFFGRLMAIEAAESLSPRNLAHSVLDLRFRSARLFESIQTAAQAPRSIELVARDVRRRVQV